MLNLHDELLESLDQLLDKVGAPDSEGWALADRICGLAGERESLAEALCADEMRDIRDQELLDWFSMAKHITPCPKCGRWLTSLWLCPVCGIRYHMVEDA